MFATLTLPAAQSREQPNRRRSLSKNDPDKLGPGGYGNSLRRKANAAHCARSFVQRVQMACTMAMKETQRKGIFPRKSRHSSAGRAADL